GINCVAVLRDVKMSSSPLVHQVNPLSPWPRGQVTIKRNSSLIENRISTPADNDF
ncbi:hypothetical protein BgiMline_020437, partial [Biomphalaria glabrata]